MDKAINVEARYEKTAQKLHTQEIITAEQARAVAAYRALGIFSLHNEIRLAMYAAVLLFTAGAGILIYEHIDTIGHAVLILVLLLSAIACFVFAFRVAPEFSVYETDFHNPACNYLVLAGTLIGGLFIHYLEFQYKPFGDDFAWPAWITAAFSIFTGYRFDSRPALTIGITALAAAVGITATPQALLGGNFISETALLPAGLALAIVLSVAAIYSSRKSVKLHFIPVYHTFALHLGGICSIIGLCTDFWAYYFPVCIGINVYYWKVSHREKASYLFVFALLYAFVGLNIALARLIDQLELWEMFTLIAVLLPFYLVGAIVLYVRAIKQFNRKYE